MARKDVIWLDEQTKSKNLNGNVYIVTGANSGVGFETTRQLIKQGGHVVMACRTPAAAKEVAAEFTRLKGSCEIMQLDLSDLQSVRDFVASFLNTYKRLDGLACNAGMVSMSNTIQRTKDELEMTIG